MANTITLETVFEMSWPKSFCGILAYELKVCYLVKSFPFHRYEN